MALGLIYFFPSLYLFQFAISGIRAIDNQDSQEITKALEKQHSVYKLIGIFTAIILGFYALTLVFALLFGLSAAIFS